MKITILGSGTSSGVPVIGCDCNICTSSDPKNKRLRSSILIEHNNVSITNYILIDSGQDFREQALKFKIPKIDTVLYTHSHADHIFGLDDLRIYNFRQKTDIPIYADKNTANDLRRIFSYCFNKDPNYEGGGIPSLKLTEIKAYHKFSILEESLEVHPLEISHGRKTILGYKIKNFAYLTDCSAAPLSTINELKNIDTLIISGLRNRPHKTHFTIDEAIEFSLNTSAKNIYLTHIAHEVDHGVTSAKLKHESQKYQKNIELCYDGQIIDI